MDYYPGSWDLSLIVKLIMRIKEKMRKSSLFYLKRSVCGQLCFESVFLDKIDEKI